MGGKEDDTSITADLTEAKRSLTEKHNYNHV